MPVRVAFVMEQSLGHVTHSQNLGGALARRTDVAGTWIPIPFPVAGLARVVPAFRANWSVRAGLRARIALRRELARRPQDSLFFHTQVTALFSVRLMRKIPSVVSLDATPINYDSVGASYGHRPAGDGWLDARKHRMNREVFDAAAGIVTWSDWAARSLVADYGVARAKITVIAPGASRRHFEIGGERADRRRRDGPTRFLFVGGDFARKGGRELIEALGSARTARPIEVHIVTRDPVPAAPGVVVHHGVLPNSTELLTLFRDADVFILPSRGECLSVALMEAAAAGLPIITTGVGALGEAAIHGQTALVVPPDDVRSLRSAIEALADDDARRDRLSRQALALARAKFDADRNNLSLLDLIVGVARPERRSAA